MYARMGNLARPGRMARPHRLSGLRGLRGRMGDDGIDWSSIITTGITQAGNVAKVAVAPGPLPTYQSITNPYGYSSVTSYAPAGTVIPGVTGATSSLGGLDTLLTSPLVLLGGLALLAVVLMKR